MMLRDRREAELARWVRALPDDVVRRRPVLGIGFVAALAQVSDFATVGKRLSDIERSLRQDDGRWPQQPPPDLIVVDQDAYRSLPGEIHLYRAALDLAGGDLDGTVTQAREAMSLAPPDDALTRASASALGGLASLTTGDLPGAHAAYTRTVAELTSIGFVADVLGCCITLGDIRRAQGRLGDALRTYQRALDLAPPEAGARSRCAEPPTCTSGSQGCCSSGTTSRRPVNTWTSAVASAITSGCRRTRTGGASPWPG